MSGQNVVHQATSIFEPYNGISLENAPIDRRLTPRDVVRNRKYDGAHVLFHCRVINAPGDGTAKALCGGLFDSRALLLRGDVNALAPRQRIVVDGIVEDPVDSRARNQSVSVRVLNIQ